MCEVEQLLRFEVVELVKFKFKFKFVVVVEIVSCQCFTQAVVPVPVERPESVGQVLVRV